MRAIAAHDTPSGTRMMWNASVNAICERAHGTGLTASTDSGRSSTRVPHVEILRTGAHRVDVRCHEPRPGGRDPDRSRQRWVYLFPVVRHVDDGPRPRGRGCKHLLRPRAE